MQPIPISVCFLSFKLLFKGNAPWGILGLIDSSHVRELYIVLKNSDLLQQHIYSNFIIYYTLYQRFLIPYPTGASLEEPRSSHLLECS